MFTQRHYNSIARFLSQYPEDKPDGLSHISKEALVSAFSNFFAGDNQRFNREKFINACRSK